MGVFGGKEEIMSRFNPAHPESIWHSGTFNGTDLVMAAGLAALEILDLPAIERINALGVDLRKGFTDAINRMAIKCKVTGFGSLSQVHWTNKPLLNARDCAQTISNAGELQVLLHLEMMNRGIYSAPRGAFTISTPMTKKEAKRTIEAFSGTLELLKPYIAKELPHLLMS